MSTPAPGEPARSLLHDVRADPHGWSWLDIRKLLEAWGFRAERLEPVRGWEVLLIVHPEHRDLNMVLQSEDVVHSVVSLRAVHLVDTLITRQER